MDIMKKTKIEQYLQGPLWALLILAFVDIVFFFLDIRCGVILAVSLVVFLVFQMIIYSRSKQEIIKECMDFMFEQSQVQNYLLQQLPVPYALLDGNGMIIWSNDAFHKIVGENRGKSLQQIFPNLNRNLLPSDVMHSISHIEYKKKCKEGDKEKEQTLFYKVEMNRIRVEDFSDENDNSCSRQMLNVICIEFPRLIVLISSRIENLFSLILSKYFCSNTTKYLSLSVLFTTPETFWINLLILRSATAISIDRFTASISSRISS